MSEGYSVVDIRVYHTCILVDHKRTFEDHFLNIVQKTNQKLDILAKISKYMP